MKIVVIGGTSFSTPLLVRELNLLSVADKLDIVLAGRSKERLHAVSHAARLLCGMIRLNLEAVEIDTAEFDEKLTDATVVLLQIRVGGFDSRVADERLAERFETFGDQENGPVSVSAAWRAWPTIEHLLGRILVNSPGALTIVLSSPVNIFVRLAAKRYPGLSVWGICELPWITLRDVCNMLHVPAESTQFSYYGINHFGLFHELRVNESDLIARYSRTLNHRGLSSEGLEWGIPTSPTRDYLENRAGRRGPRRKGRGALLNGLSRQAFAAFDQGCKGKICKTLLRRPAPWYRYAFVPLIADLAGVTSKDIVFLSAARTTAVAERFTDVYEEPYVVRNGKFTALESRGGVPNPEFRAVVSQLLTFERRATEALLGRDLRALAEALTVHPWLTPGQRARDLADAINICCISPEGEKIR